MWTGIYLISMGLTGGFAFYSANISSLSDVYSLYKQATLPFKVLYSMLVWFVFLWTVSTTLAYSPLEIILLEGVFVQVSGVFYLTAQLIHVILIQNLLWNPSDYEKLDVQEVLEKTSQIDESVKELEDLPSDEDTSKESSTETTVEQESQKS
jgi:hypothetical protein